MTQINLTLVDQHLIVAQKVKIAAGDINSVVLHIDFDAAWDSFRERKAIFANDAVNGGKTQDILLIGNECIVPHEVLAKEGTLTISVTGYTLDGTTRKTSTNAKLRVHPSLTDATTTVSPTMDLYRQYLAAMDAGVAPHFEAYVEELRAIAQSTEGVVLWENPEGTVAFVAQEVALNLSEYKRFTILFCTIGDDGTVRAYCEFSFSTKGVNYTVHTPERHGSSSGISGRKLTITDSGIEFEDGYNVSANVDNKSVIPIKIIGYKFL